MLPPDDAPTKSLSGPGQPERPERGLLFQPGHRVGHFVIRQVLGEGGFGVVYQAEQTEPVRRMVALKVIKPGMDTRAVVARFEAERQALAMMDHPCVARVLDGGVTDDGAPYFAMELVKGLPITDHCDQNRLTVEDRLDLFIRVCEAVQHAHSKGVIHRDLKPSNILVEYQDGQSTPKVIDFGVAKALSQKLTEATIFTQQGQLIGTPAYMSPEQAEMGAQDIDTRSDVYSLGVILYELLTGKRPFETETLRHAAILEIQRVIRQVEPPKPSTRLASLISGSADPSTATGIASARRTELKTLAGVLRRDLDWVVMKCLEKDRGRRYDTANALAMELSRYLAHEPVLAGPPTVRYKLGKFARRNRVGVAAGLVVASALVVATGVSIAFGVAAERARTRTVAALTDRDSALRAETERAEQLQLVADFQSSQLGAIEPEQMGAQLRASLIDAAPPASRDALAADLDAINFTNIALGTLRANIFERTIAAIDRQFGSQPEVQAQLLQSIANTLRELGLLDAAADPQRRALEIRRSHLGAEHRATLVSATKLSLLLIRQGRYSEAQPLIMETMAGTRRALGADNPIALVSVSQAGMVLKLLGRPAEAEPYYRASVDGTRRAFGDDHPYTLMPIHNLGDILMALGRLDEAEPYCREAEQGLRRVRGDDHPSTLYSIYNMGYLLQLQGKLDAAEPYFREALERRRRVLGDDHPETMSTIEAMGHLLQLQGRLDEAEPFFREALEHRRRVLGDDHPETVRLVDSMCNLLQTRGALEEAESCMLEALEYRRRVLGDEDPETVRLVESMCNLLQARGALEEAERYCRETLEHRRRVLSDDHPETLIALIRMGDLLQLQRRYDEAEPYLRDALVRRRRVLGDDHPDTLYSLHLLGWVLRSQGRMEEAEACTREALERRRRVLGDDDQRTLDSIYQMGQFLQEQERWAASEPFVREALERSRRVLGDDHRDTLHCFNIMGRLCEAQDQESDAERFFRTALTGFRAALGDEHPETLEAIRYFAFFLNKTGRTEEAEGLAREAMEGLRSVRGEHDPVTLGCMSNLALILADLDRGDEALALADEALNRGRPVLGSDHWMIGNYLGKRGRALQVLERYGDAEQDMLAAHEILVERFGPTHEQSKRVAGYLVGLYTQWQEAEPDGGHEAQVERWRAELEAINITTEPSSVGSPQRAK